MSQELLRGALYEKHLAAGAAMAEEAGWEMPLRYLGGLEEALATRATCGVFDVSHFGRLRIRGDDSLPLLERACTIDVVHQEDDTARRTLLCNADGGVVDDCRLLRLEDSWLLVTSPVNRLKVLEHLQSLAAALNVKIDDQTLKTSMLSVVGPQAQARLDAALPEKISSLAPGQVKVGSMLLARYFAIREVFAGLWSLEVILPNLFAGQAWRFITEKAGDSIVPPAGLCGYDILRVEGGLPRYGYELNETIDPITAGLESLVEPKGEFLGASAVRAAREKGSSRKLCGLILDPPPNADDGPERVPRQGSAVRDRDGADVGAVTSATFSPTLGKVLAMAYLRRDVADGIGAKLQVEVGDAPLEAQVSPLPFA